MAGGGGGKMIYFILGALVGGAGLYIMAPLAHKFQAGFAKPGYAYRAYRY